MSTSTLTAIQTQMNFYTFPILMVLGSIGNIFIFIFFNQQRPNACSIYLMHSAITNLLYLLSNGFLEIFSVSYYDQTLRALILCKLNIYIPNFLGQVAKTILILACIDRYMITSDRAGIRAFSTPKRAKYFIFFSYIFWLVAVIHTPIWTTVSNGQCTRLGIYATVFTFYIILFVGVIPSAILCIFGYLTYRNIRQMRRRIQPTGQDTSNTNNFLQRRDRDLLVLVIAEVIVYIITASLLPAVLLEMMITQYVMLNKSLPHLLAEIFTVNIAFLLLFILSAAPFYTYIISSKSFRRDFKQMIMNCYRKETRQAPGQNNLRIGPKATQGDTHV
jgi:hypothetical protein